MLKFHNARVPKLGSLLKISKTVKPYWAVAKELRSKYHLPAIFFLFDIFYCRLVYGASLRDDYLYFKMYSMRWFEKKRYVTFGKFIKQTRWFFTKDMNEVVDSKRGFLANFEEFHRRNYLFLPCEKSDLKIFLSNNPVVFVKENYSNCACGVKKYHSEFVLGDDTLLEKIAKIDGAIEEGVVQHDEMAKLNPSTVNTIRIATMVEKDKNIRICTAALRIGAKGADVDNNHAGGCAYEVDPESGVVICYGKTIEGKKNIYSPTGRIVPGFQIPLWDKVKKDVISAAKKYPQARFVGWDVAIGKEAPIFIEANNCCGETLYQWCEGEWPYFLEQR